jgi:hypothetical protein
VELTTEEKQIIQEKRDADALLEKRKKFYNEVLILAGTWLQWQAETGMGLTWSTFVNQFDYSYRTSGDYEPKQLYEALKETLNTAALHAEKYRG